MKGPAGVCLLVAIAAALSACAGSHRVDSPGTLVAARTISSSRLILGGRVRCTATVSTPVEAGQELGLSFTLHNVSGSAVRAPVMEGSVWVVVKAADGTRYNSRTAFFAGGSSGGPDRPPVTIAPGAKTTMGTERVLVRWPGPLRITPGCEQQTLPSLRVGVTAPGPPPDNRTAVADVVAATGNLLDHCRPEEPGIAVDGEIDPPSGDGASMDARCSVTLHSEGRFLVAQALVLIPPSLRDVHVRQPYETLTLGKPRRPYAAIAWEFVVTRDGAVTVAAFTHDAARAANHMVPEWIWSGSSWGEPGSVRCGFEGFSGGPVLDLVTGCP